MPSYAQLVIGPAGSGKSTYCSAMQKHCQTIGRNVHVVNLDPAAEHFEYEPVADIRELIHVDDAMQDSDLHFGPNGGLVFCMEFLIQNLDWLDEALNATDDDYFLLDCPGQIELYSHLPVMNRLVDHLNQKDFHLCAVFMMDSHFLVEPSHFISGILAALSAMMALSIPHVNIMSKVDLLSKAQKRDLERYLSPDMRELLDEAGESKRHRGLPASRYKNLTRAIAGVVDNMSLVRFIALDLGDEESPAEVLLNVDMALQYGEDQEPSNRAYEMLDKVNEDPDE